jgi:AcrR family transcriptional regulator
VAVDTASKIVAAAKVRLLTDGFAKLSTRAVADEAGVPLSQIHYHFGSKQELVLALLRTENERLLDRQREMFASDLPLWKRWEMACDFLEDDLESGYVRVLHEMAAAGWSDEAIAAEVRDDLGKWFDLLAGVASAAAGGVGLGPFTPGEVAALAGLPFLGAETVILLGFTERQVPVRSALRKVGELLRAIEEGSEQ